MESMTYQTPEKPEEPLLLSGPPLPRVICPLCEGRRVHVLSLTPRPCICCKGVGLYVVDTFEGHDPTEARAYELGLHPRPTKTS
jgi:hypothetical protein